MKRIFLVFFVVLGWATPALAQQLGEGMHRSGTVGIQNETEKELFGSLICTCGCPREALDSCTCGFAHARRAELRDMLDDGMSIGQIQDAYVAKYGAAALAVPRDKGSSKLLYIVPLVSIIAGGALVILVLRRFRRRSKAEGVAFEATDAYEDALRDGRVAHDGAGSTKPKAKRDAYDEKLDDELRKLDDD